MPEGGQSLTFAKNVGRVFPVVVVAVAVAAAAAAAAVVAAVAAAEAEAAVTAAAVMAAAAAVAVVVDVTKPAYEEARTTLLILHFSIKTRKFREVKNVSAVLPESYR
jgi:ethanolamine ammonia-lyase large subunit